MCFAKSLPGSGTWPNPRLQGRLQAEGTSLLVIHSKFTVRARSAPGTGAEQQRGERRLGEGHWDRPGAPRGAERSTERNRVCGLLAWQRPQGVAEAASRTERDPEGARGRPSYPPLLERLPRRPAGR